MNTIYCIIINGTVYQIGLDNKYIERRLGDYSTVILPCSPIEEVPSGKVKNKRETLKKVKKHIKGYYNNVGPVIYDAINDNVIKSISVGDTVPELQINELIEKLKLKKLDEFCQENYK
jgi:hypothetical protein